MVTRIAPARARENGALLLSFSILILLNIPAGLNAQALSKEYIRLGGRVIAIEPGDNATCATLPNDVPATVVSGQPFTATLRMLNVGGSVWFRDNGYNLNKGPQNATAWTSISITPPSSQIASGETAVFKVAATAPQSSGSYTFEWIMNRNTSDFGTACTNTINVASSVTPTLNPTGDNNVPGPGTSGVFYISAPVNTCFGWSIDLIVYCQTSWRKSTSCCCRKNAGQWVQSEQGLRIRQNRSRR